MKRRTLLKAMSSLGVLPALSYSALSRGVVDGGHEGPLLLQVHVVGALPLDVPGHACGVLLARGAD